MESESSPHPRQSHRHVFRLCMWPLRKGIDVLGQLMKRGLPGSDAWLSPPDEKVPPSGDSVIYVCRDVGNYGSDGGGDEVEVEVQVWFDEGSISDAQVNGQPFELSDDERQRAEEDWAQREPEEHHDADAYDRLGDR